MQAAKQRAYMESQLHTTARKGYAEVAEILLQHMSSPQDFKPEPEPEPVAMVAAGELKATAKPTVEREPEPQPQPQPNSPTQVSEGIPPASAGGEQRLPAFLDDLDLSDFTEFVVSEGYSFVSDLVDADDDDLQELVEGSGMKKPQVTNSQRERLALRSFSSYMIACCQDMLIVSCEFERSVNGF